MVYVQISFQVTSDLDSIGRTTLSPEQASGGWQEISIMNTNYISDRILEQEFNRNREAWSY